jgi:YD repeat-containing protein
MTEEARIGGLSFLAGFSPDQELPPESRTQLEAFAARAFPDDVYASTRHAYDAAGRPIERIMRFGTMSEERTTYEYGDHGDLVEEASSDWSRSMNSGDNGGVDQGDREVSAHQTRYEYRYDDRGNWTERITFHRSDRDAPFRRVQIERRVVTYHDSLTAGHVDPVRV